MKKFLSLFLAATLTLSLASPALATSVDEAFPIVNQYEGYADVAEDDWYYENAKLCYEVGLITGTDTGFAPTATMTVAEVATVALRLSDMLAGGDGVLAPAEADGNWYDSAIDGMEALATEDGLWLGQQVSALLEAPEEAVTRKGFLLMLALVLPDQYLTAINDVVVPDTSDFDVLDFYNAGILTGMDEYGSFYPYNTLTRAEAATMVSRVVREELRVTFTPEEIPASVMLERLIGLPLDTALVTMGEVTITLEDIASEVVIVVDDLKWLCESEGYPFNWTDYTYMEYDFVTYVFWGACFQAIYTKWVQTETSDLNLTEADLPEEYDSVLELMEESSVTGLGVVLALRGHTEATWQESFLLGQRLEALGESIDQDYYDFLQTFELTCEEGFDYFQIPSFYQAVQDMMSETAAG